MAGTAGRRSGTAQILPMKRTTSAHLCGNCRVKDVDCCLQGLPRIHGCPSEETTEAIVNRLLKILLAAEIPLGGQHGNLSKQELYLFQFAAIHMAEPSARPAKIMWREMVQLHLLSDTSHHVPNDVLRDSLAPGRTMPNAD
jgi:hypothetical protein